MGTMSCSRSISTGMANDEVVVDELQAPLLEHEDGDPQVSSASKGLRATFVAYYPTLLTTFFFFMWYFLNVIFNILNKKILNYFPYPYFLSTIELTVGTIYCLISWIVRLPKRATITKDQLFLLLPIAICHAIGHVTTNISFATMAVSFTHTIKALEPFFSATATRFILHQVVPYTVWLSLIPVVVGVCMASVTEISFNWLGFSGAMVANVAFTYRNIYSKKAMIGMDSTNVYAYITVMSLLCCIPLPILMEGQELLHGIEDVLQTIGLQKFLFDLLLVGLFYHTYNQLATNTLERVAPLSHAVGNVLKRIFVIGFSILVFGNPISTQTGVGTAIAIAGVALYSFIKARIEEHRKVALPQRAPLLK